MKDSQPSVLPDVKTAVMTLLGIIPTIYQYELTISRTSTEGVKSEFKYHKTPDYGERLKLYREMVSEEAELIAIAGGSSVVTLICYKDRDQKGTTIKQVTFTCTKND